MIEKSLAIVSNKTRRGSLALRNDLRNSFRVERVLERNSLKLKRKLVEDRDRTLKALALRSKQKERDRKGGVGGALSLLGGGALGRRFFGRPRGGGGLRIPKVPKVPTRGGAFLSRVGKVGRFGKIGPLAILGTGLDFAGRKAEGQTNLQAGLGAGGGLVGASAGLKIGAAIGTAILPGVGTVIGGIGGSIIGGLAGGRLADIFSGADRRRKFEEQRVILSTQKTLFSSALDDFDRVLDKLEKTSPFLVLRRDDDEFFGRSPLGRILPKPKPPKTPFLQQPLVKDIGYIALSSLIATLAVIAVGSSPGTPEDAGLILLLRQTVQKSPFLMKIAKKFIKFQKATPKVKPQKLDKFDELIPGVDIPAISAKGLRVRAEAILKKLNPNIKFDKIDKIKKVKPKSIEESNKNIRDFIEKNQENLSPDSPLLKMFRKIRKRGDVKVNPNRKFESGSFDMQNPKVNKISGDSNLSFDSESTTGSDNIALAPTNNIFLINQENSTSSTPTTQGGSTILIGKGTMNSFDAEINIRQMEILQTA